MFHQDLPIEKSEKDIFNRSNYAKNLAEALLKSEYKSSFVVGLYGSWGSGKTSLCNMIIERIEKIKTSKQNVVPESVKSEIESQQSSKEENAKNENTNNENTQEQVIIFQFNPWLCSDVNQLIEQFFVQLSEVIKKNKTIGERLNTLLVEYGDLLSFTKFIPGVGHYLELLTEIGIQKVKEKTRDRDIQKVKDDISDEVEKKNIKLFITIDDIDRLSEQEIVAVFQLVKALGDFPNTIYFLCFDYDIVTTALNNIHENKGKEYLEKIVQFPVSMPKFKSIELEKIFETSVKEILSPKDKNKIEDEENSQRWFAYKLEIMQYIKSIRDIHRFMNTFSLVYNQLHEETDVLDLLGITCLQVFEPTLYHDLYFYKDTLFDKKGRDYRVLIKELCDNSRTITNNNETQILLQNLFYKINPSSLLDNETNQREKRICDKKSFDRYFTFALFETDISKVELENMLYQADEVTQIEILKIFIQKNNFSEVIDEIIAYLHDNNKPLSNQQLRYLYKNLALLWEKIIKISPDAKRKYEYLIGVIADKFDHDKLYSLLKDLVANREISVFLVAQIVGQKFKHSIKDNKIGLLDNKENEILNCLMDRIEKLLQDKEGNDFFSKNLTFDINFMQLLKKINSEQANNILKKLFSDFSFYLTFISPSLYTKGEGDIKVWYLGGDIKEFLDYSSLNEQIDTSVTDNKILNYNRETQLNIVAFNLLISNYKNMQTDDPKYIFDTDVKSTLEKIKNELQQP